MEIKIHIANTENITNLSQSDLLQINEIVTALVSSGSLTGVKGGQTIIHFDAAGLFQGVESAYWLWRRRKS